eukprot:TRINITY_DN44289_c0_g1_i2.p1 TRINITY_DN44289_c0_g1~~TRINITY_DN44289_c0_g1_i2.p1  ORF type:complete len:600 (-),score=109.80 TRINITY_DN44289_c0_g1_i2:179-1936(-)
MDINPVRRTSAPSNPVDTKTEICAIMREVSEELQKHQTDVEAIFSRTISSLQKKEDMQGHVSQRSSSSLRKGKGKEVHESQEPDEVIAFNADDNKSVESCCKDLATVKQACASPVLAIVPKPDKEAQILPGELMSEAPQIQRAGTNKQSADGSPWKKKAVKKGLFIETAAHEVEKNRLHRFVSSQFYEYSSIMVIILNSIFLAVQTQYSAEQAMSDARNGAAIRDDVPTSFTVIGVVFNFLFTIDLVLRWSDEGLVRFWLADDVLWNFLDFVIVTVGLLDTVLVFMQATGAGDQVAATVTRDFSVHRVLRVVRIVKIARIIRVFKFFRELRMMISSIMNSLKSLIWVMLILFLLFFVFGTSFASATTSHLDTLEKWRDPDNADLILYFGTLGVSIISLYQAMSGGNDWAVYFDALSRLGLFAQSFFILFITFAIMCVVNIVTGVFVDSALAANTQDKKMVVQEELEVKKQKLNQIRDLFDELDTDDTGVFDCDEFERRLSDERVRAYLASLQLDATDATALFRLLDSDQSNEVSIDEFVNGCYRLMGEATSFDAKLMQYEVTFLKDAMAEVRTLCRQFAQQSDGG